MSEYVTNEAWHRFVGRAEAIDDVADQFERRAPQPADPGKHAAAVEQVAARWPRSARGWRSAGRLHPHVGRLADS